MPKPPILPAIEWKPVFEGGREWKEWLKRGEAPDNQKAMDEMRAGFELPADIAAFLKELPRKVHIVAIAEDWCGDVVRHAPLLQAMADASPNLEVRYIHREDHTDLFARYLTNGGEAIPKFIFLSDNWVECGNWGPMPDDCKEVIARGKACGDVGAARQITGEMYQADSDRRIVVEELAHHIDIAASKSPDPKESLLASKAAVSA